MAIHLMTAKILLIEGDRSDHASFGPDLVKKGFNVQQVPNGGAALASLKIFEPDVVVVDAASLRTSGKRICQSLRKVVSSLPLLLIVGKNQGTLEKVNVNVVLALPFTVHKLTNRIRTLLPVDNTDLLHVGQIDLNLKQRQLRCQNRQAKLTPRLVTLLKVLMEHPGEVLERELLFRLVWETEYTVDTRTLDVHVSWLRRALETDPRHPRFLKTVRGVGYRLDA
jgi:DNA-binding response OmpR family regulator